MIFFVTPAWGRYELTAVCLEQRKLVIDHLATEGLEAHCVVIADDENLDTARAIGFDTVEQNNDGLGRRFNDGMQYAGEHGAEWIVPIGSDSWIDPAYFLPLPHNTRTSGMYAAVAADRMALLDVGGNGAGPYMFHRSLLEGCGFRPAEDHLKRNIDSSTIRGIGRPITWERRDLHSMQYIGFRGVPHITRYEDLKNIWGVSEVHDPLTALSEHYPADLVSRAMATL